MDELDPLRDFRSGGPELDETTEARIRARVFGAPIDLRSDDRDQGSHGPSSEPRLDRVPEYATVAPPHPGRRHARWLAAAAVVVVLLVAGLSVTVRRSTNDTTDPAATNLTIEDLAARAAAQPDRALKPGEYAYVESVTGSLEQTAAGPNTVLRAEQIWVGADDTGRRFHDTTRIGTATTGTNVSVEGGSATAITPGGVGGFGGLTYQQLRSLPTQANTFTTELMRIRKMDDPATYAPSLPPVLASPVVTPAARAAAIRGLALQGTPLGTIRDRQGRAGLGLSVPNRDGQSVVFVFDEQTGALLGSFTIPQGAAPDPAAATAWYDVIGAGVGNALPNG